MNSREIFRMNGEKIPLSITDDLHRHESLCNQNRAQSREAWNIRRRVKNELWKFGLSWDSEGLVACGHPYQKYIDATNTVFFVCHETPPKYIGTLSYDGQPLVTYEKACQELDETKDEAFIVVLSDGDQRKLARLAESKRQSAGTVRWTKDLIFCDEFSTRPLSLVFDEDCGEYAWYKTDMGDYMLVQSDGRCGGCYKTKKTPQERREIEESWDSDEGYG